MVSAPVRTRNTSEIADQQEGKGAQGEGPAPAERPEVSRATVGGS